jgi:hypothetical protein
MSTGLRWRSSCERGNDISGFIKETEIIDQLNDGQPKVRAACS